MTGDSDTDPATEDYPSLKTYLRNSRRLSTWFLYATIIAYALAYSSFSFTNTDAHALPDLLLNAVSIVALICLVGAPIAIWRDATAVRAQTDWTPTRPLYMLGSVLIGFPGIFILMYYLHTRRSAFRTTYYEDVAPEETPE